MQSMEQTLERVEKRQETHRNMTDGGMEISLFGRGTSHRSEARLLNFGRDGVCLLSRKRFPNQAVVYVQVIGEQPFSEKNGRKETPRNGALARVVWVRNAEDGRYPYKIGMKYYPHSEVNF